MARAESKNKLDMNGSRRPKGAISKDDGSRKADIKVAPYKPTHLQGTTNGKTKHTYGIDGKRDN